MNAKLNTDTPQSFISNGSNTSFSAEDILAKAQQYAQEHELNFSGSLSPVDAWQLVQQGEAVLVDVRTNEERKFVGYVLKVFMSLGQQARHLIVIHAFKRT